MKHFHKSSHMTFECGELIDRVAGETFDITVITFWGEETLSPPIIVDYYFGEYDEGLTDEYIDAWLTKRNVKNDWLKLAVNCTDIISDYYTVNKDILQDAEFDVQRVKITSTLHDLKRLLYVNGLERW